MVYAMGRKAKFEALANLVASLLGWALVAPLTWLVPRDPRLVVFYGRDGGKFLDNCKHLFARANQRADLGIAPVYLARDRGLAGRLRALGARADVVGSAAGAWRWLRAGTICVDSIDWMRGWRFAGARGARVVQMWHGIPLKLVQIARVRARPPKRNPVARLAFAAYLTVTGRFTRTEWFLSTSGFVTGNAFAASFLYRHVSHAGYPRNDALFAADGPLSDQGVDEAARGAIAAHRRRSPQARVGLYAPTFRESMQDPFANGTIDLATLSAAATRLDCLLLIKLHPWMHGRVHSPELPGICFVAPESDAYPLLREADFLVTDYSSIFFDFLLLDRPVLFFPYDLEHYLANERSMYFDYAAMAPGPKPRTLETLVGELESLCAGRDDWQAERSRVRNLVFDHPDGHAADRLLDELFPRPPS